MGQLLGAPSHVADYIIPGTNAGSVAARVAQNESNN
jgi:hypothetical protein